MSIRLLIFLYILYVYIKLLIRNIGFLFILFFTFIYLIVSRDALAHVESLQRTPFLEIILFSYLISLIIFLYIANRVGNILLIMKLYNNPITMTSFYRVLFTLINLIPMLPVIMSTIYLMSLLMSAHLLWLSVYIFFLSLVMASIDFRIGMLFAMASILTALMSMNTIITLIIPILALILKKTKVVAPIILIPEKFKFIFIPLSNYIFFLSIFVILIFLNYLANTGEVVTIIISMKEAGGVIFHDFKTSVVFLAITTGIYGYILPYLLNMTNRYVDAYLWYLRAILGTPWRERVVKVFIYFSLTAVVTMPLYQIMTAFAKVNHISALVAWGVFVGIVVMARPDSHGAGLAAVLLYLMPQYLGHGIPVDHTEHLYVLLILLMAVTLYDLHIKINKTLLRSS